MSLSLIILPIHTGGINHSPVATRNPKRYLGIKLSLALLRVGPNSHVVSGAIGSYESQSPLSNSGSTYDVSHFGNLARTRLLDTVAQFLLRITVARVEVGIPVLIW